MRKPATAIFIIFTGKLDQAVCMNCGRITDARGEVTTETLCAGCGMAATLKPNIVFFGENLLRMNEVDALLDKCWLLIAVGTSGAYILPTLLPALPVITAPIR